MKTYDGVLKPELMQHFPSGTAAATFPNWVANLAGLEQFLCVAGMLNPPFYEVKGLLVWDRHVADHLEKSEPSTEFGDDPETIERYFNTINLWEFFLTRADESVDHDELIKAFGQTLQHFWSTSLKVIFPNRTYRFEITDNLFNEDGPCLTFWQERR